MFRSIAMPYLAKFVAPIAMGIAAIGIALFLRSLARRSWFGMVVGGLVGTAGSVVGHGAGLLAVMMLYGQLWSSITPHEAFDFKPGDEVPQIRSRISVSMRTSGQFLRFVAPPETITIAVHGRFDRSPAEDCRRRAMASKRDAPAWWNPAAAPGPAGQPEEGRRRVGRAVVLTAMCHRGLWF
jgi:hypothetical protein